MKRVKDYLNELDRKQLVGAFFTYAEEKLGGKLEDLLGVKGMSRDEAEYEKCRVMDEFIQELAGMDITECENGKTYVVCAYPSFSSLFRPQGVPEHVLFCKEELCSDAEQFNCYNNYKTSPHSEMVGFYVSDTTYTQLYIYQTIAQVLYNAVCFGLHQEYLEDTYKKYISGDVWGAWYKEYDFQDTQFLITTNEPSIQFDENIPLDKELQNHWFEIFKAQREFNQYGMKRECNLLRERLLQDEE